MSDLFPLKVEMTRQNGSCLSVLIGGPQVVQRAALSWEILTGKHLHNTETRWVDYGADNYAGVTFSNILKKTDVTMLHRLDEQCITLKMFQTKNCGRRTIQEN
jgi:sucrose-6-phosphate hydrolase SacC (GH32 family)